LCGFDGNVSLPLNHTPILFGIQ